jgi:hypothetical protein
MDDAPETTRLNAPGWYRPHGARVDHYFAPAPEHAGGGFISLCGGWGFDDGREVYKPRGEILYSRCEKCCHRQQELTAAREIH